MSETYATIQPLAISHIDQNAPANDSDDETERVKHEGITGVDEEQISGKMDIIGITDWTDIPDWKEGDGSPLMELPLEILDEIFCVRPELSVRDYVALAGTCKFFRHQMTEDYWKSVLFELQPFESFADHWLHPVPHPNTGPIKNPFSRQVPHCWVPHPRRLEDVDREEPDDRRRRVSQWETRNGKYSPWNPPAHVPGHYIPRGPRSTWTKAQYTVHKEEQASWREERDKRALRDKEGALQDIYDNLHDYRDGKIIGLEGEPESGLRTPGIEPFSCFDSDAVTEIHCTDKTVVQKTGGRSGFWGEYNDKKTRGAETSPPKGPASTGNSEDDPWEVPVSDISEDEDEFEWLQQQGARPVHNYWSSWARVDAVKSLDLWISKDDAVKQYRLTDCQLTPLQSFVTMRTNYREPLVYYFLCAVEARAFKIHGGAAAHKAYVTAMEQRDAADEERKQKEFEEAALNSASSASSSAIAT